MKKLSMKPEQSFTDSERNNGNKEAKAMQNYWDIRLRKKSDSYCDKMEPGEWLEISYVRFYSLENYYGSLVEKDPLCILKQLGDDSKCYGFMAIDYS